MRYLKTNLLFIITFLWLLCSCMSGTNCRIKNTEQDELETMELKVKKELVTFPAEDDVVVTGDLSILENKQENPFIILFHQARFSRGEYKETSENFLEMGYNCLAIDQRSGDSINGVVNETHLDAVKKGLPTEYADAMPDLVAAIEYVKDNYDPEKLLILGSSYSASLALIIAAQEPDLVSAVLAFSPGEYFKYDDATIEEYASEIMVPVFITSAKNEYKNWKNIYEAIPDTEKQKFIPDFDGIHGSKALWESTEGHEQYWKAVKKFLDSL